MIAGARDTIAELIPQFGLIAFISGRGIHDLQQLVDLSGCGYAGNHGCELQLPGHAVHIAAAAVAWQPTIERFARQWDSVFLNHWGIFIEEKGVTLSVHWRNAADPEATQAEILRVCEPAARALGLTVTWGRMVMEARPPVPLNKGTAAGELLTDSRLGHVIAIGDDTTDVDTWRAIHQLRDAGALETAIAIAATGPETPDAVRAEADICVCGPEEVRDLLNAIAASLNEREIQKSGHAEH
jgi:trehalose 6-phosphate phosphatase